MMFNDEPEIFICYLETGYHIVQATSYLLGSYGLKFLILDLLSSNFSDYRLVLCLSAEHF